MSRRFWLSAALLVTLVAFSAYWYGASRTPDASKPAKGQPPVPVSVARATTRDLPVLLEVVGRGEAYATVSLKARVDGQVAAVVFSPGQHVRAGDELVRLDGTDFALRVRQAEANLGRSAAQLSKARRDSGRQIALRERGFISDEKVNETRTAEAVIDATLRADRAAVDLARAQLSYATVRAPFAGVVGAHLVFPGAAVKLNDTVLAVVNRVRPLYVSFSVPERHLPRLRQALARGGASCRPAACLQVEVTVPGEASRRFVGAVRFIDNAVDTTTGTIQVKAVVANDDEALTPGQFLNVALTLDTLKQAVVVPSQAIQQGPEGPFLFAVNGEGVAEVRRIGVGASFAGVTAVSGTIQSGEQVVIDGQLRLAPGSKVQIAPEAPGVPPSANSS
ncbi:efflux RND transporter periplasmic adaptor subunit [Accumulibacter sp.]|uniref:efflux RND transporter periplasmic adaptor subunit n=1 Tax=Accumulibacter sp. TaxID=2053492 RepID=UPI00287AF3DF|nr:efflux RND transporter periplasmic adaptor subunit [Accumulibacter sp.]MDS4056309.1 efflux RND transporter periplasmic adaptor subunit [Accumulibacter sp.]HMW63134.1 efflux RND transporter periplasmic adaptor subunit [Accumulibacter sp.]HMW78864.1 efflux RND transporter periplasmic adaptor subunit [Accumulibacter sp.]HNB66426.1 efflux RND transporter periplasmic adaptor subunit [Accumulibacter sp.]HNC26291.1 efflux RND transporter periplasmic adaptor subunit [Accumulibacter sp.]